MSAKFLATESAVVRHPHEGDWELQSVGKNVVEADVVKMTAFVFVKPRLGVSQEYRPSIIFYLVPWGIKASQAYVYANWGIYTRFSFKMATTPSGNTLGYADSQAVTGGVAPNQTVQENQTSNRTNNQLSVDPITGNVLVPWTRDEHWYAVANTYNGYTGTITSYLLEAKTGTLLWKGSSTEALDPSLAPFQNTEMPINGSRINGYIGGYSDSSNQHVDWSMKVGEVAYWQDELTEAEIISMAQTGFANLNRPNKLNFNWNFMKNWASVDPTIIPDESGNGYDGVIQNVYMQSSFDTDNPVPVFIPLITANEHDFLGVDIFSGTAGECRWGIYPRGHAAPTPADVWNGAAPATSTGSVVLDGASASQVQITQPDTGTEYDIYFTQDETGGGSYTDVTLLEYRSPTKYSEVITDVTGAEVTNQTGIQWAWFDEENPSTLTTAVTQGVAELTDATGLLEITLPTSITTPKGSKGTMVLRADWDGSIQTASHVVEVK